MKQVIVVNAALRLPPGKLAAQVAHAAVGALLRSDRKALTAWLEAGMPKIVVQCASDDELQALAVKAEAAGLPLLLVRDAGRTVVAAGTPTCLGIGPAAPADIDPVTGALTLVP